MPREEMAQPDVVPSRLFLLPEVEIPVHAGLIMTVDQADEASHVIGLTEGDQKSLGLAGFYLHLEHLLLFGRLFPVALLMPARKVFVDLLLVGTLKACVSAPEFVTTNSTVSPGVTLIASGSKAISLASTSILRGPSTVPASCPQAPSTIDNRAITETRDFRMFSSLASPERQTYLLPGRAGAMAHSNHG